MRCIFCTVVIALIGFLQAQCWSVHMTLGVSLAWYFSFCFLFYFFFSFYFSFIFSFIFCFIFSFIFCFLFLLFVFDDWISEILSLSIYMCWKKPVDEVTNAQHMHSCICTGDNRHRCTWFRTLLELTVKYMHTSWLWGDW